MVGRIFLTADVVALTCQPAVRLVCVAQIMVIRWRNFVTKPYMKLLKYSIVAVAMLAVLSTSAFATPATNGVPDTSSTMGLLGCAFAGLAGMRAWLKK